MASTYWMKLYYEILDDPKMGRLPCNLWRRFIECCLIAGEIQEEGFLPDIATISWRLRIDERTLHQELTSLSDYGMLSIKEYNPFETRWHVTNFTKRQAPSPVAERVRKHRERQSNKHVTKSYASNAPDKITDEITDEGIQLPLPSTPLEASKHPDIAMFKKVSKVFPGRDDYRVIIDAMRLIRIKHPDEGELESYLLPFWLAWSVRKTKDGQPFKKTNPAWLTEWAVNNDIPPVSKNGSEPKVNQPHPALQGMTRA